MPSRASLSRVRTERAARTMMVAKKKARESEKFEVQQWVNICHQEIDRASDSGQNSTHVCFDRSVYTKLAERVATKLRRGGYSVHVIEEHQSDLGLHVTIGWPSKK